MLAYLLVDEVYALGISRYRRSGASPAGHWYVLGPAVSPIRVAKPFRDVLR